MSHTLGSRCAVCHAVLVDRPCPECGHVHGHWDVIPSPWAKRNYPGHPCFADQADPSPDGEDGWAAP